MCIIANPVVKVASTKIWVSPNKDGTRQLTIYSNNVDTMTKNAMILPVPTTDADSIKFIDLSFYQNFFNDCKSCFRSTKLFTYSSGDTLGVTLSSNSLKRSTLAVHDVGSYKASIVPSLSDFDRLDTTVFRVDADLADMLKSTYSSGFAFIVCQLEKGSVNYHPFAYTHTLAQNGKLFVPTKHWHAHTNNGAGNSWLPGFLPRNAFSGRGGLYGQDMDYLRSTVSADWDHIIYSPNTNLDSCMNDQYEFVNTNPIDWQKLPSDYRWASFAKLNRWTKEGDWNNKDIEASFNVSSVPTDLKSISHPVIPASSGLPWGMRLPW